ncbi:MAG: M15 family metallopeptidase [Acidobacteriaceae bacterium]
MLFSIGARLQWFQALFCVSILQLALQVGAAQEVSFRITPVRPVSELRAEALRASPPKEEGAFRKSDLVELVKLDPTIKLDIRYATSNNFLGTPLYTQARAFLQRPAAEALVRANRELQKQGYGLIIHDGYRPWYVTEIFWEATPNDKKIFVANPRPGSKHNRGCAVDLSLYDLKTGKEVQMPSGYDEMTPRAYANYPGGTSEEHARRALLRQAMEKQGFIVNPDEWWHFDYKDWKLYPIQNLKFEDL